MLDRRVADDEKTEPACNDFVGKGALDQVLAVQETSRPLKRWVARSLRAPKPVDQ